MYGVHQQKASQSYDKLHLLRKSSVGPSVNILISLIFEFNVEGTNVAFSWYILIAQTSDGSGIKCIF
jgi:hypothetical protein